VRGAIGGSLPAWLDLGVAILYRAGYHWPSISSQQSSSTIDIE